MADQTETSPGGVPRIIPKKGSYFDRSDHPGELHSRTYYVDGVAVIYLVATLDQERPGKWTVGVRWLRRKKWNTHGWGPLADEKEAMTLMDAMGIGAEAMAGGCTFVGHLEANVPTEDPA